MFTGQLHFFVFLMKSLPLLLIVALSSCSSSAVRVIDSKTKAPVAGASVKAVHGNVSTGSAYTDGEGYDADMVPPNGPDEIVVSRSGYNTKRVKAY